MKNLMTIVFLGLISSVSMAATPLSETDKGSMTQARIDVLSSRRYIKNMDLDTTGGFTVNFTNRINECPEKLYTVIVPDGMPAFSHFADIAAKEGLAKLIVMSNYHNSCASLEDNALIMSFSTPLAAVGVNVGLDVKWNNKADLTTVEASALNDYQATFWYQLESQPNVWHKYQRDAKNTAVVEGSHILRVNTPFVGVKSDIGITKVAICASYLNSTNVSEKYDISVPDTFYFQKK